MTNKTVWVLEDDPLCNKIYDQVLSKEFNLVHMDTIAEFKEKITTKDIERPLIIIVDLILKDGNFLDFITYEKAILSKFDVPYIVVSGIDDIDILRFCFKEGTWDYLTKPFSKTELLAKIEIILRDSRKITKSLKSSVVYNGLEIQNLTSKQSKLLNLFISSDDGVVNRDNIMTTVWGTTTVNPKTVDVHLYNLRRKIKDYGLVIKSEGDGKWSLLTERV